jgi:hypothetical protein
MNDPIVFKPSLGRLLIRQIAGPVVGVLLGLAIYAILTGNLRVESWLVFTIGAFSAILAWYLFPLSSNPNLYTIEITDQQIIVPMTWRLAVVPVKEVDITKSHRRSWRETRLGLHWFRSLEGKRLFWFDDFVYGKGQFDRLLEIISQLQNASATQL